MEANDISEVVKRGNVEEYYIQPLEKITSENGLHFERPDDRFTVVYQGTPYSVLSGNGNHIMLTGYDLYFIRDNNIVKIRIEHL